jgi:hypothetical protein
MIRLLGRAAATAALGAFAAAATLAALYSVDPELVFEMGRPAGPLLRGFHRPERDPGGFTFAWTTNRATVLLPDLDRRSAWSVDIRARGARPDPATLPDVTVEVDGLTVLRRRMTNDFQDIAVAIPERGARTGASVSLIVSNTFAPGPRDSRKLGVQVDRIAVSPVGGVALPPRRALAGASVAGLTQGAAFGIVGFTAAAAAGAAVLMGALIAVPISLGLGPYSEFPIAAAWIAFWVAAGLVAVRAIGAEMVSRPLRQTARFVLGFSAGVLCLKLLVLFHPDLFIGDALFQAHRLQSVLRGNLFFTSTAPGEYEFPYAIALYIVAAPFSWFVRIADHVQLLRVLVAVSDAAAGALLYPIIARSTGDRLAGAIAVALYHMVPVGFDVQTTGNLTNTFGQSLFVGAAALAIAAPLGPRSPAATAWLLVMLTAAFLAHTSTFAILLVTGIATGLSFRVLGGRDLAPAGTIVLAATVTAAIVAFAAYYVQFMDVYREMFARIGGEVTRPAELSDPGGRSMAVRAASVASRAVSRFGWPIVIMATAGAWRLSAENPRSRLALGVSGWLLSCALFLVIGIVTPVDMRHLLAAFPALAILSAIAAAWSWRAGGWLKVTSAVMLAWAVGVGAREWLRTIT